MKISSTLKFLLLQGVLLTVFLPASAVTGELSFQSETILRMFDRDIREDGKETKKDVLPVYEYFRLDATSLMKQELSFHSYGWARHDVAKSGLYSDDTEGEFLYGYLEYAGSLNNFLLRLGRQYAFERALGESVDGLVVNADVSPYISVMAYGGRPISLEDTSGSSGDATVGGRIANHYGNRYELGLFYKYVANDGDQDKEEAGFDLSLLLPWEISLSGRSRRNLVTDGWAEHTYEGMFKIGDAEVRPSFDYFHYEDFLIKRDNSAHLFRFLSDTDETITVVASDLIYSIAPTVDVGARLKHYDYDKRQDSAQYYSGLAVWRWEELSELGVELGFMNGGTSDTRYYLGRAYVYKNLPPGFITADFVYARYHDEVMGEDQSLFVSLGTGRNFLDDDLKIKLSGDFSSDPFFESDVRGMINVTYNFDYPRSPKEP